MARLFYLFFMFFPAGELFAQFYNGSFQEFGKNRVKYDDFFWSYYKFERFSVYFYNGGKNTAVYTAKTAASTLDDLEKRFDYYLNEDERISFIVYNKIENFQQSNIGLDDGTENDIGGVTRISGTKVFLYFNGNHEDLNRQIKAGIAEIIITQMMYGDSWKDVVKNSALLTLPKWYMDGLISFFSDQWNIQMDNKVKDGILDGRYDKFNHMEGEEGKYAGHAMWNYISETYGANVIPNILYMTRISRNIESGFLFVLGSSLKSLTDETIAYYRKRYEEEDDSRVAPSGEQLPVKIKKSRIYRNFKISPDGKFAAFSTAEMGQKKVWLYNFNTKKLKKIKVLGHKLDRINDGIYPLLAWHPAGKVLSIIAEEKGQVLLTFFTPDTSGKWKVKGGTFVSKPIFKLEKILDFSYSPDGKNMVMSAMANGQSDVYVYKIGPNIQEAITNDSFDDFSSAYLSPNEIIFSSNRSNDTLFQITPPAEPAGKNNFDLFLYKTSQPGRTRILKHVTNSSSNETFAREYSKGNFCFLSDENGISNRYSAYFDSVISSIDTAFHYRYITKSLPLTNYYRSILEQNTEVKSNKYSEIVFSEGKSGLYFGEMPLNPNISDFEMENTGFKEKLLKQEEIDNEKSRFPTPKADQDKKENKNLNDGNLFFGSDSAMAGESAKTETGKVSMQSILIPEGNSDSSNAALIDINNYKFASDKQPNEKAKGTKESNPGGETIGEDSPAGKISLINDENKTSLSKNSEPVGFTLPNQQTYNIHFNATEITTQFDFNFANQLYQRYNGGPFVNPGLGSVIKIGLLDLFEDYRIEGGIRYAYNSKSNEYFVSLDDRSRKIDKKYILQRQTITSSLGNLSAQKTFIHQGKFVFKYPFSEVAALRATVNLRNDKIVTLSTERNSLQTPSIISNQAGFKLEYVFDNSIKKGRNLYNGFRGKIFAEHYRDLSTDSASQYQHLIKENTDLSVLGFDFRYYQKIHRELIWANRFSASTSFGHRKLIYYLGSVDNWVLLSDKQRFDFSTPISSTQNYFYQTLATPMRGFIQNVRNGNSFAVINSEVRCPVFKYLMSKPIKSDFVSNFQTILFTDIGTAWTGKSPYAPGNTFNEKIFTPEDNTIQLPPGSYIILKNHKNPVVGGFGWGLRTRLWGYFIRFDRARGVEDGIVQKPINYFSVGLDF